MKRVVDIFSKDWSHEILWTYVIEIGNSTSLTTTEAFEIEALRLAVEENRGDEATIFAKTRE